MEEPKCKKCNDTGWCYNEGYYGWDYGGYYPCECPKGQAEEEEYTRIMEDCTWRTVNDRLVHPDR